MNRGFTVIETLVSLTVISMGLLFMARVITFAHDHGRKAGLRFDILQTTDSHKQRLLSLPFQDRELAEGGHSQRQGHFTIRWSIDSPESGLKRIRLVVVAARCGRSLTFYKSEWIKEVKHD